MDASSSGGAPAPFLLKTYEMVDDSSTDAIVSWSVNNNSFIVWNPPEFARILLPKYFKHNNFSSFIRQLNTYGFRKIDSERWEFANEDFVKDQKHLLKNIHRRKPIHSHSHQPGSVADPERVTLEEEIERLSQEKAQLEASLLSINQSAGEKLQMEDLMRRVAILEKRQANFRSVVEKAVLDPTFVELLGRKLESMDLSSYKKRRLPQVNHSQSVESNFVDDQSSCRPEFSNIFQQDSSNKLRLELSPAVSDVNMLSHSTESSNEGGSPRRRILEPKDTQVRTEGLLFTPEAIELSGTDTSFNFKMNTPGFERVARDESSELHSSQHRLIANEDGDGLVSCHLNLSLASSPLQANKCSYSARGQQEGLNVVKSLDLGGKSDTGAFQLERNCADGAPNLGSSQAIPKPNQAPPAAPHPVNDVFWEQFLTERPGSSDNEEASSNYRANSSEEHESSYGMFRNAKNMERLTL